MVATPMPAQQAGRRYRRLTTSTETYRQIHSQQSAIDSLAVDEARRITASIAQGLHERDVEHQRLLRCRRQNHSQHHDDDAREAASSHRSIDVSSDAQSANDDDSDEYQDEDQDEEESSDTDGDSGSDDEDEDNDEADVATDHYAYRRHHG